jgi:hypothetical protein
MNKTQVQFYLKRHVIAIVLLLGAIGFCVYGYMWMDGSKGGITKAEQEFTSAVEQRAILERGQEMGGSTGIKVDPANVDAANTEVGIHEGFIKDAQKVIRTDSIAAMNSGEYIVHMSSVIEELNQRAREARVGMPSDTTNANAKIQYNFTFKHLRGTTELAKDKLPELLHQLKDIRTISEILNRSGVQSIVALKRTRVTNEDFLAGQSNDYLDTRQSYTGTFSAGDAEIKMKVRPYQVRFQCLSGSIAKVLTAFAAEKKTFYVVRKMEVTQLGAKTPSASPFGGGSGEGGMSSGMMQPGGGGVPPGFPAGGMPPGGGASGEGGAPPGGGAFPGSGASPTAPKPTKVISPAQLQWLIQNGLATPKAKNVISESILEVELDLDVIRKQKSEATGELNPEPGNPPAPAPGNPPAPAPGNPPVPAPSSPPTNSPPAK